MEPVYEYSDGQWFLNAALVVIAMGLFALGFAPLEDNPPAPIVWMVRSLIVIGPALLIALPYVRLKAYADRILVTYGIGLIRITLPVETITGVRAVEYNPMRDFGGWGIKGGGGEWKGWIAYTASITNKALAIETEGRKYLFGCPNPEEAEAMLKSVVGKK
jgi:hypothetical protein